MPLLLLLLSFGTLLHQSQEQQTAATVTIVPKKEQAKIINKINDIRRRVKPTARNMLKMKWSDKAAQSAKEWANQCNVESIPESMRTIDGIYCGLGRVQSTYELSWSEVFDMWHKEKSNFYYRLGAKNINKPVLGYIMLIWYSTHNIGCAVAHCKHKEYAYYYVCRTCPAGNLVTQIPKPYKNGRPCGACPNNCENKLCTNSCQYQNTREDCEHLQGTFDCSHQWMEKNCKASCSCPNKIF